MGLVGAWRARGACARARLWAAEAYLAAAAHSPPLRATSNRSRDTLHQPRVSGVGFPLYCFPFYLFPFLGCGGWGFTLPLGSAPALSRGLSTLSLFSLSIFLSSLFSILIGASRPRPLSLAIPPGACARPSTCPVVG